MGPNYSTDNNLHSLPPIQLRRRQLPANSVKRKWCNFNYLQQQEQVNGDWAGTAMSGRAAKCKSPTKCGNLDEEEPNWWVFLNHNWRKLSFSITRILWQLAVFFFYLPPQNKHINFVTWTVPVLRQCKNVTSAPLRMNECRIFLTFGFTIECVPWAVGVSTVP